MWVNCSWLDGLSWLDISWLDKLSWSRRRSWSGRQLVVREEFGGWMILRPHNLAVHSKCFNNTHRVVSVPISRIFAVLQRRSVAMTISLQCYRTHWKVVRTWPIFSHFPMPACSSSGAWAGAAARSGMTAKVVSGEIPRPSCTNGKCAES